jgi:hypothetical protein
VAGCVPAPLARCGLDSRINQAISSKIIFRTGPGSALDTLEQNGNNVLVMFPFEEAGMLKIFVEEAAALASITLFVGMIAVWAQLIPQL